MKIRTTILILFCGVNLLNAQVTIFTEGVGFAAGGQEPIATHIFQNSSIFTYTGTGLGIGLSDTRNSAPSNYTNASATGNVCFPNSSSGFVISGINTLGLTNLSLSLGQYKGSSNAIYNTALTIWVSDDGVAWSQLLYTRSTSATGWAMIYPTGTIPSTANLRIRFENDSSPGIQFRIDDITLKGSPTATWANLQSPASGSIITGGGFIVNARVFASGYTYVDGAQSAMTAEIGYSSTNSDPSGPGWTWVPALYSTQIGNNDEYLLDLGSEIFFPGTYYYASRFSAAGGPYVYGGYSASGGGVWNGTTNVSGVLTVIDSQVVFANAQSPFSGTQAALQTYNVYAQVYQPGLTEGPGQGFGVQAWIGYSTSNTNPSSAGWTWVPAVYNPSVTGNNDEYVADIGQYLNANTTFYYASRFQLGTGTYSYGGFYTDGSPGNFWDGTNYISGTVVVTGATGPNDYYRSLTSGQWEDIYSWQSSTDNISWQNATRSPSDASLSIQIRNGHTITTSTNIIANDITVDVGGTLEIVSGNFTLSNGAAVNDFVVNGDFTNSGATFTAAGALVVAGKYNHATTSLTLPIATWLPGSTCNVTGLANQTQVALINAGQIYHNFTFNNTDALQLASVTGPVFQVNGTLTLGPNSSSYLLLATTAGTYTRTVNKIVVLSGQLTVSGSQSVVTLDVADDVTVNGGRFGLSGGSNGKATVNIANGLTIGGTGIVSMVDHPSAQSPQLTVGGNMLLTGWEPTLDLESISSPAVSVVNVVGNLTCNSLSDGYPLIDFGNGIVANNVLNLGGNFTKMSDGLIVTSSTNAAKGFVFNGTALQTFLDTGIYVSDHVNYTINSGSTVKLNSDLTLGGGASLPYSQFLVNTGAALDFGTHSIIASDATSKFIALSTTNPPAHLLTAHPDGLGGTVPTGSLQNFADVGIASTNAVRLQAGIDYTFYGNTTTPFPIPTNAVTSAGAVIIDAQVQSNIDGQLIILHELTVNSGGTYTLNPLSVINDHRLSPGSTFTIAANATLDNGGENRILRGSGAATAVIDGRFITRDVQGFIGSNSALSGYPVAAIALGPNSVIEYGLTGDQQVQGGTAPTYVNVEFSGSGVKTLQSANSVSGTITVSDSAVFDAVNNSFGIAATNVTMTDTSRFKTGGSGVKPDAGGTYSLAPGTTIEYYSPSVANTNPRKSGVLYANVDISGNNITNTGVTGLKFQPGGLFTVKTSAIFKLENPAGFSGSPGTSIDILNSPTIVLDPGSTIEYSALGNQTITPLAPAYSNLKISGTGIKSFPFSPEIKVSEDLLVIAATLQIDPNVTMTVTDSVLNSGGIIDIKDSGSLVQVTDVINATANNNTGNVRVARNANDMYRYDFTYWSSPVTLSSAFTVFDLSPLTRFDKYFKWNSTTQSWLMILNGNENMMPGVGYIARAPDNFPMNPGLTLPYAAQFDGVPNNGIVTVPIMGSTSPIAANFKYNLLGNPYPSALFADAFIAANPDLNGTLYFWTHNTGPAGPDANGNYYYATAADSATYNLSGGTAAAPSAALGGANTNIPTGKIGTGQGFFIRGVSNGASNALFNNSMRIVGQNGQFYRNAAGSKFSGPNIERHRIWLNLTNSEGGFSQCLTAYATGATNGLDRLFDGEVLGGETIAFYSLVDSTKLSSQGRVLPFDVEDLVPLGYRSVSEGPVTITLEALDGLFEAQNIYIEDKLLKVIHDIKQGAYVFKTGIGTFDDRFVLRFTPGSSKLDLEDLDFQVAVRDRIINLRSTGGRMASVTIYDLVGHTLYSADNINANKYNVSNLVLTTQVLIIKTEFTDGRLEIRKIVY